MTNLEAEGVLREIGKVRVAKKVSLISFDSWFLFGISNRIYNALVLTKNQQKYMLLILYKLKNDKYKTPTRGDEDETRPVPPKNKPVR